MSRQKGGRHRTDERGSGQAPRTKAEWVSLIISSILLAGVVATVVALWISPSDSPARFEISRGAIRVEGDRYYLPVIVKNTGDETGAQVTLTGKVRHEGGEEEATTTFDFIPGHSEAEGALIFSRDPVEADVQVSSYQKP